MKLDAIAFEQGTGIFDSPAYLHYWGAKHPDLHAWMCARFKAKGERPSNPRCRTLQLTMVDLDDLEAAILEDALPKTRWFRFRSSIEAEREDDLWFVRKARAAIREGQEVYYSADW